MVTLEQVVYIVPVLGLTASIFYYAMVLRNQNKTRQAQTYMNIYNTARSMEFRKARRIVNSILWTTPESFMELVFNEDQERDENNVSFVTVGTFYEGLGVLVREELINIRLISLFMGGEIRRFWERLVPIVDGVREIMDYPRLWSETEYLYNELIRYMKEHPDVAT